MLYAFVHKGTLPEAEKLVEEQSGSKMDESVDTGSRSLDAVEILQKFCEQPCEKLSDEFDAEKEPEVSKAFVHIYNFLIFSFEYVALLKVWFGLSTSFESDLRYNQAMIFGSICNVILLLC